MYPKRKVDAGTTLGFVINSIAEASSILSLIPSALSRLKQPDPGTRKLGDLGEPQNTPSSRDLTRTHIKLSKSRGFPGVPGEMMGGGGGCQSHESTVSFGVQNALSTSKTRFSASKTRFRRLKFAFDD